MKITKDFRIMCLVLSFGGYINKYGTLTIHEKNIKILEYKKKLLKNKCKITKINETQYELKTNTFKFLRLYRRIIYKNKKSYSLKILNKFNEFHLLLIFLDIAKINYNNNQIKNIIFKTNMSKESNQIFIDYLNHKYSITAIQLKDNNNFKIRFNKENSLKLIEIIKQYKINYNSYKLMSVKNKI